jgi:hypothetical protein
LAVILLERRQIGMAIKEIVISSDHLEDEYFIKYIPNLAVVSVDNLSVPDKCLFCIHDVEQKEIIKAFDEQNWERFICELIEYGYLN